MNNFVGYVRVSTVEQNIERQMEEMIKRGVLEQNIYVDKASGKDIAGRQNFQIMCEKVAKGNMIFFHDFSRAARNLDDLRDFIKKMLDKGVDLTFLKEGLVLEGEMKPMQELILNILGSLAEFFRTSMLEAQAEGIAIAKAKGMYKGTKQLLSKQDVVKIKEEIALGVPKAVIARKWKIHLQTLYLALKRFDKGLCVEETEKRKESMEKASPEKDVVRYFRRKELLPMEKAKEIASMVMSMTKPTHEKIRLLLGANTDLITHHIELAAKYIMETKKKWAS